MPTSKELKLQTKQKGSLFNVFKNKETYETIFNTEDDLRLFSFENDNVFYGKIDAKNNPIMVDTDFLSSVTSLNNPVRMCDVAAKAFRDMQAYFADAKELINNDSKFYDLKAHKGYSSLNKEYVDYLTNYHSYFVNAIDNETDKKILNIDTFFNIFIEICTHMIKFQQLPLTRTGFLLSNFCSPFISGLVVELATDDISDDQTKYDSYIRDDNFKFFLETATRFNFLVDKNVPWRLVFDLSSKDLLNEEPIDVCGTTREKGYLKQFDLNSIDDFFNKRYFKTMLGTRYEETTELYSLKNIFLQMYNTIIIPNKEFTYGKENATDGVIKIAKNVREAVSLKTMNELISDEKWLRFLLYIRALESKQLWNQIEFDKYYAKTLIMKETYGIRQAIDFINVSTRNIFNIDKPSRLLQDRTTLVNKFNKIGEGFKY